MSAGTRVTAQPPSRRLLASHSAVAADAFACAMAPSGHALRSGTRAVHAASGSLSASIKLVVSEYGDATADAGKTFM